MALGPDSAARLARRVLAIYLEAERILLERVARRIARGMGEAGWAEHKLAEVQAMRADARSVVRSLDRLVPEEVAEAVTQGWDLGVADAATDLTKIGIEAVAPERGLTAIITEAVTRLTSTHLRILRVSDDAYRGAIARAAPQVLVGAQTRRDAAQAALDDFAASGVTGFVDDSGRSWNLASYAEMATRAATGRAAITGHIESIRAVGHDLVIVSDSPRECELCRPFEGKVLSISGVGDRPSLASAIAAGLFHPGCTHNVGIYVEGVTRPLRRTADPEGDKAKQQQRYLERGLRRWKRREAVAISDEARALANAKVAEWRKKLQAHIAAHDLKRQSHREQINAAI